MANSWAQTSTSSPRMNNIRGGFTIIELLFVVLVIGALVALLLPAIQSSREAARRHNCSNNISQLILAVQHYESIHRVYPPGTINDRGPIDNRPFGYHASWITQILPLIEEDAVFRQIDFKLSMYHPKNAVARAYQPGMLACPSSPFPAAGNLGASCYAGVHNDLEAPIDVDNHGVFFLNSRLTADDIRDGRAETLFLGEKITWENSDLGWMSGTRATLRNAGWTINYDLSLRSTNRWSGSDPWLEMSDVDESGAAGAESALEGGMEADGMNAGETTKSDGSEAGAEMADSLTAESRYDFMLPPGQLPPTPKKPQLIVGGFSSFHPGGAQFATGDGAVRFLPQTLDQIVYYQLAHRADGLLLDSADWR